VACAEFTAAMDDDLSTPAAIAAVHSVVREGNQALAAGDDANARGAASSARAMMGTLGLDPFAEHWSRSSPRESRSEQALATLVSAALEERARARKERDFALADALRDRLAAAGITVEDTPNGPEWTLE
jgi:cysteinyl-tRNA synthetase